MLQKGFDCSASPLVSRDYLENMYFNLSVAPCYYATHCIRQNVDWQDGLQCKGIFSVLHHMIRRLEYVCWWQHVCTTRHINRAYSILGNPLI